MDLARLLCALGLLVLVLPEQLKAVNAGAVGGSRSCGFPAIYNFGDSNSDTGAISAAISEVPPPNGESFFGHPSGRFSDGRLIIDFIGKQLLYLSCHALQVSTLSTRLYQLYRVNNRSPIIFYLVLNFVQLRNCSYHTSVHTWTHLGPISGMVQILQLVVHLLGRAATAHFILVFNFPSS